MPIKTILLDFDGTLVDSIPIMKSVYHDFFTQYQLSPEKCPFEELMGPPMTEIMATIQTRFNLSLPTEELLNNYFTILSNKYLDAQPAYSSIDFLLWAKSQSIQLMIVTSNVKTHVENWLKQWNVAHCIDDIISSEDVSRGKPHPEPYLKAIERSGCELTNIIAVEDSVQGVQAAVSAKLKTFCLKSDYTRHDNSLNWIDDFSTLRNLIINRFD